MVNVVNFLIISVFSLTMKGKKTELTKENFVQSSGMGTHMFGACLFLSPEVYARRQTSTFTVLWSTWHWKDQHYSGLC